MKVFAAKMKKNNNRSNVQLKMAKPAQTVTSRTAAVKSTRDHIMQLHKTICNRAVTQMIENGTLTLTQEPALQRSQVLQLLTVKATLTNDRGSYDGENGNRSDTLSNLGTGDRGPRVKERMDKMQQIVSNRDVYDCAEPHALSKLVKASSDNTIAKDMTQASVGDAAARSGNSGPWSYLAPCGNCKQWVRGNKGSFSIANRIIPGWNRQVDQQYRR